MISFFSGLFLCLIAENHTLTTLLHNESSYLYTTCLKNWEFDKKASQNSDLKRATIVRAQGASEDENFEKKPTQSKTNFSDMLCIHPKAIETTQILNAKITQSHPSTHKKQKSLRKSPQNQRNAIEEARSLIHEKIHTIPSDELEQLKALFVHFFLNHGFSYTLFGDKPISCDVSFHENLDGLFQGSKYQFRLWKKYENLFPSKNYLFLFCEHDRNQDFKSEITFINKRAFRETFEKHYDKFIEAFGEGISAEKLLNLLIKKKSLWNTPLKDHHDLLGILLGFGKINAELYDKKEKLAGTPSKQGFKCIQMEPSLGYVSVEEELQEIENRLTGFCPENGQVKVMSLPGFVADHSHPETIDLIKKYKQQRRDILKKYHNRCVLEATLEQICRD